MDCGHRGWRGAGMVAARQSAVLLVGSRRLTVSLGAASGCRHKASFRTTGEHPALSQPYSVVEEPVPGRTGPRRRTGQDRLQPRRAHRERVDHGASAAATRRPVTLSTAGSEFPEEQPARCAPRQAPRDELESAKHLCLCCVLRAPGRGGTTGQSEARAP